MKPVGGNWVAVVTGNYDNIISLTISSDNDIQMYSDFTVSANPIRQGTPFDVSVNVYNAGTTNFTGTYSIDLHALDGTYIETLSEINENTDCPRTSPTTLRESHSTTILPTLIPAVTYWSYGSGPPMEIGK